MIMKNEKRKKFSGIYAILNIVNEKVYIGSATHLYNRWKNHRGYLNSGVHYNAHLQRAWNKYSKYNFIFTVLEYCPVEVLIDREQYYLDLLKSYDPEFGYNIRTKAEDNTGLKHTNEFKLNMSLRFKNKPKSEETKAKISAARNKITK